MNLELKTFVSTTFLTNILRLASNMLLASWLNPGAFALVGIVGSIVFAFEMFSDAGFKAFLLRHKDGDKLDFLNTVWTSHLIRSLILGVLFFLFSGVIAESFTIPDLQLALQLTSLSFLIRAIEPIGYLLAERQGNVAQVLKLEFVVFISVTLITVTTVYLTQSVWALIFAAILSSLIRTSLGYIVFGRFGSSFSFNIVYVKELLGWAMFIVPSSIITLLLSQLDKFILGKTLSLAELGLYYIAFNLSSAAFNFVINYPRRILMPPMAKIFRDTPELYKKEFYQHKTKSSVVIAFLIGVGMGGASIFFTTFYDVRYIAAADYLSLLLLTPILSLITYSGEVSFVIHGKLKMSLVMNLLRLFWLFLTTWFAYTYLGPLGVVISFSTIEVLPVLYVWIKLSSLNLLNMKKELLILLAAALGLIIGIMASNIFSLLKIK